MSRASCRLQHSTTESHHPFIPLDVKFRHQQVQSTVYSSPKNGYICLVETKLWRNPEARRVVVAQILDYASHVRTWRYSDLDQIWRKGNPHSSGLYEVVRRAGYEEHDWIDRVNTNLQDGRMALAIVGEGIRSELHTLTEAVGAQPGFQYRLALVEMRLYENGEQRLIVPVTVAKTVEIERAVVRIHGVPGIEVDVELPEITPTRDGEGKRAVFSEENLRSELLRMQNGAVKAQVAERLLSALKVSSLDLSDGKAPVWLSRQKSRQALATFCRWAGCIRLAGFMPACRGSKSSCGAPGIMTLRSTRRSNFIAGSWNQPDFAPRAPETISWWTSRS
jgi:hypothetical protein